MQTHQTADPQLEEVILSHCFAEQTLIEHPKLKPELFTLPRHRSLFEQMKKLRLQGDAITADAIKLEQPELEDAAKKLSLRRLGDVTSKTVIRKLCEMHRRRTMQDVAAHLNEAAVTADDPDAVMSEQLSRLMAEEGDGEETIKGLGQVDELIELMEWRATHPGQIRGISTGFRKLDAITDGMHPGLITVAARPSCGKSTLLMNIAMNVALDMEASGDRRCIYLGSFEQNTIEVQSRAACFLSGCPFTPDGLTQQQMMAFATAVKKMKSLPLLVDDRSTPKVEYVISKLRKLHRERGVKIAFIDYAQLLGCDKVRGERVAELDRITKSLHAIGRELDIPVVAAAQLKRKEKVWSKEAGAFITQPPTIDEVKGSGTFEEDSYAVWMIHVNGEGDSTLMVGKNRHGPRDREIPLTYAAAIYRFAEK